MGDLGGVDRERVVEMDVVEARDMPQVAPENLVHIRSILAE